MRLGDVEFGADGDTVIAQVSGEIELANAEGIGAAMIEAMGQDSRALVLDLTAVEYLDSAGIHLIYKLQESLRARGQVLRLVVPSSSASHDALTLAGVADHVDTIESLDQALRAIAWSVARAVEPAVDQEPRD
jgi:anti-sigma B factor antagonist